LRRAWRLTWSASDARRVGADAVEPLQTAGPNGAAASAASDSRCRRRSRCCLDRDTEQRRRRDSFRALGSHARPGSPKTLQSRLRVWTRISSATSRALLCADRVPQRAAGSSFRTATPPAVALAAQSASGDLCLASASLHQSGSMALLYSCNSRAGASPASARRHQSSTASATWLVVTASDARR
jgi:hypothetical protein